MRRVVVDVFRLCAFRDQRVPDPVEALPIGGSKEPIGAHLVEAVGEYMLEEATHELASR